MKYHYSNIQIISLLPILFLSLEQLPTSTCFQTSHPIRRYSHSILHKLPQYDIPHKHGYGYPHSHPHSTTHLQESTKNEKPKGVYTRPSAAIERGSGFYVPGLEGSRVRGLFGVVILALTGVNSMGSETVGSLVDGSAEHTSLLISISYGMVLLLQGLVEFGKERGFVVDLQGGESSNTAITNTNTKDVNVDASLEETQTANVNQYASPELIASSSEVLENLQWIAASFISLTPATHILLLRSSDSNLNLNSNSNSNSSSNKAEIVYSLGDFSTNTANPNSHDYQQAISDSITSVFASRGGRISIPLDHPGSVLVPESHRRCMVLQKIDINKEDSNSTVERYSLLVGSNQLLPAFTKNDLKWLGRLARYLELGLQG